MIIFCLLVVEIYYWKYGINIFLIIGYIDRFKFRDIWLNIQILRN